MSQHYHELNAILRNNSTDSTKNASNNTNNPLRASLDIDLRKILEKRYRSDGSLPAELSEHLFPSLAGNTASSSIFSELQEPGEDFEKKVIERVLNDPTITSKQKETIAKSILQGNYEIQRISSTQQQQQQYRYQQKVREEEARQLASHAKDFNQRQKTAMYVNRHRLPKPHFLEVLPQSVPIPSISPKKLYREKVELLKNSISVGKVRSSYREKLRSRSRSPETTTDPSAAAAADGGDPLVFSDDVERSNEHFHKLSVQSSFERGVLLPESRVSDENLPSSAFLTEAYTLDRPKTSARSATLFRDANPTYREQYSKLVAEDRLKKLKEAKAKALADRELVKRQKEYEKLSIEKSTEVKKKLSDFRHKLKEYLLKKKDPMTGEIMRVMDDSLIYYLLEKYSGYSMSPEAILALLGNSIGTSIINPDPESMKAEGENGLHLDLSVDTGGIGGGGGLSGENFLAGGESSLMKKSGLTASLSAQLSYHSLINNYKSFGTRSPTQAQQRSNSQSPPGSRPPAADNIFDNTFPPSLVFRHSVNADSSTPVSGFTLRRIEHDAHTPASANFKALAGGFRAKTPHETDIPASKEEYLRDHHPLLRNSTSPHPGDSGRRSPLVVLSSEHFRTIAKEMGYNYPSAFQLEDPLGDRQRLEQFYREEDEMHTKINDAISVMHEQLLEEGILPSLRPEKVLTMKQMEELGLKKTTVDEIFKKITGKDISHVLKRAPASRAEEIQAKLARNPTMTSSQLSLINDLLEMEREQGETANASLSEQQPMSDEIFENVAIQRSSSGDNNTILQLPKTPTAEPPPPELDKQTSSFRLLRGDTMSRLQTIPEAKSRSTDSHDDFEMRLRKSRSHDSNDSPTRQALQRAHTSPGRLPLAPDGDVSSLATAGFVLLGSQAITDQEKGHLEEMAKQESAKAAKRLVLPAARDPKEKYRELLEEFPIIKQSIERQEKEAMEQILTAGNRKKSSNPNSAKTTENPSTSAPTSANKKNKNKNKNTSKKEGNSYFKEFAELEDQYPQKGPKMIKTREMQGGSWLSQHEDPPQQQQQQQQQSPSLTLIDNRLPMNPYKSWHEETKVLNTGVPAGAGLMLWQPRDKATEIGRYRIGRNAARQAALRPLPKEIHSTSQGGGIGNPPNWNVIGYQGVHGDNIYYSKSKNRIKPFVSAT